MRRLVPILIVSLPALAHEPVNRTASDAWRWATAIALTLVCVLYLAGLRHVWRRSIHPLQATAFFAGVAAAVVALLSPLDRWSDVLFSAHMAQHEVLMLVSAPLMVWGRPFIVTLWALPAATRERIGYACRRRLVLKLWDRLTGPLTVLLMHAFVLWIWHVPALFEAALRNESIHAVQHLGFFLTAALFWWSLLHGRYGRIGYGAGVFYVFATAMHTEILGALLTFGGRTWYPTHAARTAASGMNAVDDQHLAGVLMWVPFGAVFLVVGLALLAAWLGEAERRVGYTSAARAARESRG
jgi:putative membrane protein